MMTSSSVRANPVRVLTYEPNWRLSTLHGAPVAIDDLSPAHTVWDVLQSRRGTFIVRRAWEETLRLQPEIQDRILAFAAAPGGADPDRIYNAPPDLPGLAELLLRLRPAERVDDLL